MRAFISLRTWIRAGLLCLPCLLSGGCKSTGPGMGWLSWMDPKPSSTALSSNIPTKPSLNSLPPPSSTMGPAVGSGTTLAGLPNGQSSGLGGAAGQAPANGYYTGPYGMSGQTPNSPPAGANPAYAGSAYGATNQNSAGAYGGYQSPYQSSAAPAGNAYRTADIRNNQGGAALNGNGGSTAAGTHTGTQNWNNEQWGRAESRGGSQPAGYNEGIPARGFDIPQSNSGQAADAWTPPTQAAPAAPGGYRPGSTGRSTGALSPAAPSAASIPSASGYGAPSGYGAATSTYPTSSYPTSSYPASASDAPATRNANSTGQAGGYNYPSTTQMR